ncbi:MAG: hypothetical protein JOZ97_04930 [Candidatus Eremiobacteraeota bacterium]|nr:hypothetical protein [Candidatus Eremiobacteraeota bacterium]
MMRSFLTFVFLLSVVTFAAAPQSVSAAASIALPNCVGKPQVQPTEVIITCEDAGISARNLRWTGWGESFAAA